LRFTSDLRDTAAGLYRLGARYYDPSTARFTQYDPTGQETKPGLYAAGNPVNHIDPTGGKALGCAIAWVGFATSYVGFFATLVSTPVTGPVGVAAAIGIGTGIVGTAGGLYGIGSSCGRKR